ncbi:MAG: Rne/Rng family ribonuclease [Flavobacteriales bacterium]|mgnify:CR=1 FL=1|nr:Rne/Rng family ribonuclease [Flavobacteriales bacterium]MBK6549840.1 Rne/Rng family ribonuclease [Flavobacteriales bacterium]MBK6883470.1 Rne/Rng family ribonuclease [Flavobacteriales bacterium]MBK7102357.1 Rne/Rng family ribonuclease [Flavobacteriales bacterium]MBK7113097.1 Rne/Rng family ribonuclease [Flavobacteriales bacterium]
MNIDLIIRSSNGEVALALMKDKVLAELHRERTERGFSVGDVYLAKVRKVAPGLNAAFVDVGHEKDAFLHYFDLGPQYRNAYKFAKGAVSGTVNSSLLESWKLDTDIPKEGKLADVLSASQSILVQIAKEPISTKGPRLTAEVTLAGRYMVLVPFINKTSISARITDEVERRRLKDLMNAIKPKGFGIIIRTNAEGKRTEDLEADLKTLMGRWDTMFRNLRNAQAPKKVLGEIDRTSAVLRDVLNKNFTSIHVDDELLAEEIYQTLEKTAPEKKDIVKHYKGKLDIFDNFGINRQIKQAFGKQVMLTSGAYLIVEKTEAMHVIDVNSGSRKGGNQAQEKNALDINVEAAIEIARLLRLRDMGGIICIDFIDLYEAENRRTLHRALKDAMADDKAKHNVLAPSRFGVIELTRQRVRPETEIDTSESCPTCNGTGEVEAPVLIVDQIENALNYFHGERQMSGLTLSVHPFLAAYFTKGLPSIQQKWWWRWKKWVKVKGEGSHQYLDFTVQDGEGNEIPL